MKKLLVSTVILIGLIGTTAVADPTLQSYKTLPKGTLAGNPWYYSMPAGVYPQTAGNNGHLFMARKLDMNVTTDQQLISFALPPRWTPLTIYVMNCSADPSGAVGGLYSGTGKTGNTIVTAAQTYTGLSAIFNVKTISSANSATVFTRPTNDILYFSLTTPLGTAATCDMYVDGIGWP